MKKELDLTHQKKKIRVDWEAEILNSMRLAGKGLFKVFSYIFNVVFTLFLVFVITGVIVACAFSIYIKNYADPQARPHHPYG